MLLSNRRIAFLHFLLAGMQAAWITAFFLFAWPRSLPLGTGYAIAFSGLLAWMLALELLSRAAESPLYDMLALGGLVVVSLLLAWLGLRPDVPTQDPARIAQAALSEPVGWRGLPPFVVLVGLNVILWQRASAATSRDLNFFSVGVTFRSGLLLLMLGGGLLSGLRGVAAIGLLWLYLVMGLTAVAISRVSEKASEAQSSGRLLPARRLVQVVLAAAVAATGSWLFSLAYTRQGIAAFFRLFDPLWQLLKPLLLALGIVIARLLNPLLLWFEDWLTGLISRGQARGPELNPPLAGGAGANPLVNIPRWPLDLARSAILGLMVIGAVLGIIIFLLLFLERVRKNGQLGEAEDEGLERATLGGGILQRALNGVRGAGSLVRRFGLGRDLLAAISVENIYANVCRIARRRGHPRRISQPPDMYLPALALAFPGQDERLQRITNAYMRVHYGEHAVPAGELAALRRDYRALREGGQSEAGPQPDPASPADEHHDG